MGTRSLTFVYESAKRGEKPEAIINMYRQFDGYPEGHGAELAEFLNRGRMVNGLIMTKTPQELVYNGMPCLAAQLVAHFKQEPGQFYLYPVTAEDCGQDFEYHIYRFDGELKIKVFYCGCNFFGVSGSDQHDGIFEGSLEEFTEFCKEKEAA